MGFIGGSMSGGEIILILLALLLLFGSKNLPSIARNIGKSMETFRRASREVTDEIMRADIDDEKPSAKSKTSVKTVEKMEDVKDAEVEVKPSSQAVQRDDSTRE